MVLRIVMAHVYPNRKLDVHLILLVLIAIFLLYGHIPQAYQNAQSRVSIRSADGDNDILIFKLVRHDHAPAEEKLIHRIRASDYSNNDEKLFDNSEVQEDSKENIFKSAKRSDWMKSANAGLPAQEVHNSIGQWRNPSRAIINPHNFSYVINEPKVCSNNVSILIYVHSAGGHVVYRNSIRSTWASLSSYRGWTIKTVFMLGTPSDKSFQKHIVNESKSHHDIIQEDFDDTYRNLTHKNIMGLKWVRDYCKSAKFIVKVDDDVIVDTFKVVSFVDDLYRSQSSQMFYCSVIHTSNPIRDPTDKWFVPYTEYPFHRYPSYCEGFAYILSSDLAGPLYEVSLRTHYFWIDDVWVTGILADQLHSRRKGFVRPYGYTGIYHKYFQPERVKDVMFILAKYKRRINLWDTIWGAIKSYHLVGDAHV